MKNYLPFPGNVRGLPAALRPVKKELFTYITSPLWWEIR